MGFCASVKSACFLDNITQQNHNYFYLYNIHNFNKAIPFISVSWGDMSWDMEAAIAALPLKMLLASVCDPDGIVVIKESNDNLRPSILKRSV